MLVICSVRLYCTIPWTDTDTSPEELTEAFGEAISGIVMEVTDDKSITDKAERKRLQVIHAPHLSTKAKAVKLADKISNLRDMVTSPPHDWESKRLQQYFEWAEQVTDGLRGDWSKLEAIFDQQYERKSVGGLESSQLFSKMDVG